MSKSETTATEADRKALLRTAECFEDWQDTDVGRPALDRLTALGWLDKVGRDKWAISAQGDAVLAEMGRQAMPDHVPKTTERMFPIMDGDQRSWIPWRVIAPHEAQARRNHGQSLKRLAERGGLCWSEAWGVLTGVGWSRLPKKQEDRCKAAVLAICAKEPANAR